MTPFSSLSEFMESTEAQGELERFLETYTGKLLVGAMREMALVVEGTSPGTKQDGAKFMVEGILNLTLARRNLSILAQTKGKSGGLAPTRPLQRREPPAPMRRTHPEPLPPPKP